MVGGAGSASYLGEGEELGVRHVFTIGHFAKPRVNVFPSIFKSQP